MVFDEFQQADSTITKQFGGTGLGLTICSELTNLMNGTLTVESILDTGSAFKLSLPLEAAPDTYSDTDTADGPNGPNGKLLEQDQDSLSDSAQSRLQVPVVPVLNSSSIDRSSPETSSVLEKTSVAENAQTEPDSSQVESQAIRVLIVDDNHVNRKILKHMLLSFDEWCLQIVSVGSGAAAVSACEQEKFDVILMDVCMVKSPSHTHTVSVIRFLAFSSFGFLLLFHHHSFMTLNIIMFCNISLGCRVLLRRS